LRGALARVLLRNCVSREHLDDHDGGLEKDDCQFYQLFCTALPPVFENCYPTETGFASYPLPLTARTCKDKGGFERKDRPDEHHGVYDILVRQFVFEEMLDAGVTLPYLYEQRCPRCREETKTYSGFYGEGEVKYYGPRAPVGRTTRTAINRQRAVAAEQQLYTLEAIMPPRGGGFSLVGSVLVGEDRIELLRPALQRVHHLGQGISRGLGRVEVRPKWEFEPPVADMGLGERIRRLNEEIGKEWAFYSKITTNCPPLSDGVWYFSVDLLAPALLTHRGLPSARLEVEELRLGMENGLAMVRSFARQGVSGGWHWGAGLPRRTELSTAMGSVFLFRVGGYRVQEMLGPLADLEQRGLGRERERGFGQVQICSPFHLEVM